jgi:ribosomal protein L37AE/L43A
VSRVVDIDCPNCGSPDVRTVALGEYRCRDCATAFDSTDLVAGA